MKINKETKMTLVTQNQRKAPDVRVNPDQFIGIWGFMVNDLNLAKTELIVYAVIFAMYRHRGDYFCGSRDYLRAWCNSGKTAIDTALNSLERKKLIIKEYRRFGNATKAIYTVNTDALPTHEMFDLENRNRDNNIKIAKAKLNSDS